MFNSITPILSNKNEIDIKNINFNFYNVYEDGSKAKILNKTPFVCDTNNIYVECKIKSVECSPNILKFNVNYKYTN